MSNLPTREEIDQSKGFILLEFGTDWCGHCQAAQASIAKVLSEFPEVKHSKIEDGPGQKLGRSYNVKLWPTLILIKDGTETGRCVRPEGEEEIRKLFSDLS